MAVFVADAGTTLSCNKLDINCFKSIRFCLSFLEKKYLGQRNLISACQLLVTRLDLKTVERQLNGPLFDVGWLCLGLCFSTMHSLIFTPYIC